MKEAAPTQGKLMEFRIADAFTESLARITGERQKTVKITAQSRN